MQQPKLIWLAFTFSTVIYLFIAYTIVPAPARPLEASVRTTLSLALYGAALATFIAALAVPTLLTRSPLQWKRIVALALFEACAIYGLVAAFTQQDWRLYLPTWIAALIGMLREFPKDEQIAT